MKENMEYYHPCESDDDEENMDPIAYWNSLDDDDRRVLARKRAMQFILHHPSMQII